MNKTAIFVIAVVLVQQAIAAIVSPQRICPLNQVYYSCGTACPLTCENLGKPPRACTMNCVIGCGCIKGYGKKKDGSCCMPADCPTTQPQPACQLNEIFNTCGTSCPLTCDNYKDAPLICTKECNIGCECQKGYVKNRAGSCCLPTEC